MKLVKIKNANELEFAIFCIESVATHLGVDAINVYKAFTEKSDILNSYIVPLYDILHSQGKDYIVNDILEVAKEKGIKI